MRMSENPLHVARVRCGSRTNRLVALCLLRTLAVFDLLVSRFEQAGRRDGFAIGMPGRCRVSGPAGARKVIATSPLGRAPGGVPDRGDQVLLGWCRPSG